MIVPDVNLILYAYDQDGPFHRESAANLTTDAQISALALRYRATSGRSAGG